MADTDDLSVRCGDIALAAAGHGDLDAAVADLHRLPATLPGRGRLAAALIGARLRHLRLDSPGLRDLEGLLAVAEAGPPETPRWRRLRASARAVAITFAAAEGRVADPRSALAELDVLAAEAGESPEAAPVFEAARSGLRFMVAMSDGDESAVRRLPGQFREMGASGPMVDLLTAASATMAANQAGDDPAAALAAMREAAERLPEDDPLRAAATQAVTMASSLIGAGPAPESYDDDSMSFTHRAAMLLGKGDQTDLGKVDEAIGELRGALRHAGPDSANRPFHLSGLALALLRRAELTNAIAGLDEAATLLREARELAGGPEHPQWAFLNDMLSGVEQRLGRSAKPYQASLDGLRGHAYRVLVQSDLTAAAVAAADAARDAADTARWCLQAGNPADAIAALDAGRGLALFAATELGTVAPRLRAAGRDELADRWDEGTASGDPDRLPTALRREVLSALGPTTPLNPPGLDEIREALRGLDADALVYLLPGGPALPGYAVIAPAEGPPSYLTLPNLHPEDDVDVERYIAAASARDVRDLEAVDPPDFSGRLEALCRWAWGAAMGPLIETYLHRLSGRIQGRSPRIVLVPIGGLARIPWQAARRADGTYAVELVAVSQAASARMLVHAAGLAPVAYAPLGLIVGDPATGVASDLEAARVEAYEIRKAFYRGARYVGRRPDGTPSPSGAGTTEDVGAWLRSPSPAAGAMLHLACHGFMSSGSEATAYLLLAEGKRLAAEQLGALVPAGRDIGLVVLAACRTGLAFSSYDEAYSLGTAFLAAGARSVLSTQWSVPDQATSVLMFMFHHYLMAEGRTVGEALRAAQLWMLDPGRRMPDDLPGELRGRHDLASVAAWAGFVHWGR